MLIFITVMAVLLLLPTSNGLAKTDDVALTPDQAVIEMIEALNVTSLAAREEVVLTRRTYNRLNAAQKNLVTNLNLLEKAEAQIVKHWIDSADIVTLVDEGLVYVLREEYNALNADQKALVTNADKLDELDAKLEALALIKDQNFAKAKEVQAVIERMQVLGYSDKSAADYG